MRWWCFAPLGQRQRAVAAARGHRHRARHVEGEGVEEDVDCLGLKGALLGGAAAGVVLEQVLQSALTVDVHQALLDEQPRLHLLGAHQVDHEPRADCSQLRLGGHVAQRLPLRQDRAVHAANLRAHEMRHLQRHSTVRSWRLAEGSVRKVRARGVVGCKAAAPGGRAFKPGSLVPPV